MGQYDKIGQILNETLTTGELPPKYQHTQKENNLFSRKIKNIYKIQKELDFFNLTQETLSIESLKESYHLKLKEVHPDTNFLFKKNSTESAKKIKQIKDFYKNILTFLETVENY